MIHEITHYLVAKALGLSPLIRLKLSKNYLMAISVEIPCVREYETISQIKDKRIKLKYLISAIAPYVVATILSIILINLPYVETKTLGIINIAFHIVFLPNELVQSNLKLQSLLSAVTGIVLALVIMLFVF